MQPPLQRLGLFGGSFDPVHLGHLQLAECCHAAARLDAVWFVPTAVQPLKPHGPVASNADRLAMLRLATAGQASMAVSTLETERGGTSYTVDTLRAVKKLHPKTELLLLMGADTLRDFRAWHEPAEVLRLALPLVVERAGEPPADFGVLEGLAQEERLQTLRESVVSMPPVAVSSSALRRQAAAGKPLSKGMPLAVAEYLAEHSLYRDTP